jgi:hypothetical protein
MSIVWLILGMFAVTAIGGPARRLVRREALFYAGLNISIVGMAFGVVFSIAAQAIVHFLIPPSGAAAIIMYIWDSWAAGMSAFSPIRWTSTARRSKSPSSAWRHTLPCWRLVPSCSNSDRRSRQSWAGYDSGAHLARSRHRARHPPDQRRGIFVGSGIRRGARCPIPSRTTLLPQQSQTRRTCAPRLGTASDLLR